MVEPTLEFIAKQLERILVEQREIRNENQVILGELQIIRGEIQIMKSRLIRLDYTMTDVLDRLRKLEEEKI